MSMSKNDCLEILDEMGICRKCHDHTPCGCEREYDFTPISDVLGNAIEKLNALLPKEKLFVCGICGEGNTIDELDHNNETCFNCGSAMMQKG